MGQLALALHKTLGELAELLTEEEIDYWREFYRQHPFDDHHRYHRPAAYVASRHAGSQAAAAYDAGLTFLSPKPKKPSRTLRPARVIRRKSE